MKLSTHRVIQLSNLLDVAQAAVPAYFNRAAKAASINNKGARAYFLGRAAKFHQIALRAERRLQAA